MTLAVHPLAQQAVEVIRRLRGQDGRLYVDVLHPDGRAIRLPIDWTELGVSPNSATAPARSSTQALVSLCANVEALRRSCVDVSRESETLSASELPGDHLAPPPPEPPTERDDDRAAGGRLGGPGAPNARGERGDES